MTKVADSNNHSLWYEFRHRHLKFIIASIASFGIVLVVSAVSLLAIKLFPPRHLPKD